MLSMPPTGASGDEQPLNTLGSRALSFTIPWLRVLGFATLSALVAVHTFTSAETVTWSATGWFAVGSLGYSLGAWAILWRIRSTDALKYLASRASELDILF